LVRENKVKRLLREGKPAVGSWLQLSSPLAAELMAHAGWDWLVIDAEHSPADYETMAAMMMAISTTDTIPMVRLQANSPVYFKRALDAGAYGVVVPMVNTPEEAEQAVKSAKYPPQGIRSVGTGRCLLYGGEDYRAKANDEIAVVVQIEHIDAINRAEEILSVPGVDACFIGPSDLAASMNLPVWSLDNEDPRHVDAVRRLLAAARKCGVPAGIHVASSVTANQRIQEGFQFIAVASDLTFMSRTAKAEAGAVKR
jgi:4-hydroxy-2-oxoheptanedioate aldolase